MVGKLLNKNHKNMRNHYYSFRAIEREKHQQVSRTFQDLEAQKQHMKALQKMPKQYSRVLKWVR